GVHLMDDVNRRILADGKPANANADHAVEATHDTKAEAKSTDGKPVDQHGEATGDKQGPKPYETVGGKLEQLLGPHVGSLAPTLLASTDAHVDVKLGGKPAADHNVVID